MKIFLLPFLSMVLLLSGCTTAKYAFDVDQNTVNTEQPLLSPPECVAVDLKGSKKASCVEGIQEYHEYTEEYLETLYAKTSREEVKRPNKCGKAERFRLPELKPLPVITGRITNKSDEALVNMLMKYTSQLEDYHENSIDKIKEAVNSYNTRCFGD